MIKNKIIVLLGLIVFLLVASIVCCSTYPLKQPQFEQKNRYKEADYVNAYCKGIVEYELPDKTRVDCLTDDYAIEFDYAKKWAESIGQALYYAKMTGKKPAVAIIIKKPTDRIYIERIKKVDKGITIFEIRAKNFTE